MPKMVEEAVSGVPGVGAVRVELVWDPPWTQDKMTDEARLQLGMM
jgi:metal-sulfur cluster biosynthetic enzyme